MKIAVIIPCYRVKKQILDVISRIGTEVNWIYVIDDACPEKTGEFVKLQNQDPRVQVIQLAKNQGVGGATLAGFQIAAQAGADVLVKLDGDGQMDPHLIPSLIRPIIRGQADFSKGNRFSRISHLQKMPRIRLWGNAGLSFISKASTGYWKMMDPTNGFVALHQYVYSLLPTEEIDKRYFFESDLLYRLGRVRAVHYDFPMRAVYGSETSSLKASHVLLEFAFKHLRNFLKRIFNTYFLEDFNIGSLELVVGLILTGFGFSFGIYHWIVSAIERVPATTGTVMIASLPIILGFQLLLSFLQYDISSQPIRPLSTETLD